MAANGHGMGLTARRRPYDDHMDIQPPRLPDVVLQTGRRFRCILDPAGLVRVPYVDLWVWHTKRGRAVRCMDKAGFTQPFLYQQNRWLCVGEVRAIVDTVPINSAQDIRALIAAMIGIQQARRSE